MISAAIILIVGAVIAKVVKTVAMRVFTKLKVDQHLQRLTTKAGLPGDRVRPASLAAGLVYWLIMIVTVQAVAETLGASALATSLQGLIAYLPLVLVAAAIFIATLMIADFVGDLIRDTAGERGKVAALAARVAIIAFGGFAALNQLQVAPAIVNGLFYALVGTVAVSAVIAFGVGGIPHAQDVIGEQRKRRAEKVRTMTVPDLTTR